MHRFLYLAHRRAELDAAAFARCWREHAALAATCPEMLREVRGYRQWQVVDAEGTDVMGMAETRCVDATAVYRMLECRETREVLQPDELRFLALPCRRSGIVADETVLQAQGAPGAHACLWLMPRGTAAPDALEALVAARVQPLRAAWSACVGEAAADLTLGHRDAADDESPFDAVLIARVESATLAERLTRAWGRVLPAGETAWRLERAGRA